MPPRAEKGPLAKPPPARSPAGGALNRRRPTRTSSGGASGGTRSRGQPGILRFYTDDAPGLKIGPTTVLVMSLVFIAFVVLLHIWGKFRS
mmetsp:Transcript_56224/g.76667  ORF Transcript_56224/g.76667 Transcript_56224/m.76667 type:complete len:90 (+) Transcript_56224:47-316(+)